MESKLDGKAVKRAALRRVGAPAQDKKLAIG